MPSAKTVRALAVPAACSPGGVTNQRALDSFEIRFNTATVEAQVAVPPHTTNGDETLPDLIGTYSKCIQQDSPCLVNLSAFQDFRTALTSGLNADYEAIPIGGGMGGRTLNGPQASYAFTLAGTDSSQFGDAPSPANQETAKIVPPPPPVSSEAYATELVELYWCSLLRDVAFTDYATHPYAAAAAAELSGMTKYAGPKPGGTVTTDLLFRGGYAGELNGPYMSQLLLRPTRFGAQEFSQRYITYQPGLDYMTDITTFQAVQNGIDTGFTNMEASTPQYLHNGRGLAAYTNVDELFQAYFTAYLALKTMKIKANPANPYMGSKTQNAFGTFGGPDVAATMAFIAKIALNAVWYQKWLVHLRHRPESGGGLVHLIKTGAGAGLSRQLHNKVLKSDAVKEAHKKNHSYLLSQPFPSGSPAHPAYPTGHGTVGGACITVLKFFFDGNSVIPNPTVSAPDGLSLQPYSYTGTDTDLLRVNGELNKLAHNVSFGHGIHADIHWRSDTDDSMLLGEAVAISALQDLAKTYHEHFSIPIQKLDGTTATISN